MAFIEDLAPQKITAKTLSVGLFCGTGFNKRQEKKIQRKEKKYISLAIGENYINKNVSFLLTFYLWMFLLIDNRKESENISRRKRR